MYVRSFRAQDTVQRLRGGTTLGTRPASNAAGAAAVEGPGAQHRRAWGGGGSRGVGSPGLCVGSGLATLLVPELLRPEGWAGASGGGESRQPPRPGRSWEGAGKVLGGARERARAASVSAQPAQPPSGQAGELGESRLPAAALAASAPLIISGKPLVPLLPPFKGRPRPRLHP